MSDDSLTTESLTFSSNETNSSVEGNSLSVEIKGMKSTEGKIVLTLFTKEDGFPDDPTKAFRKHIMPATELQHTFTDLPEGEYVVLAFHDENSNEILDKSKFGFPKEAIALSNHPKIGPPKPSFEKAKIDPSKNPSVTLTMTKPGL